MWKLNGRESDGVYVVWRVCNVYVWIKRATVLMLYENEWVLECDGHSTDVKPEIVFAENFAQLADEYYQVYQASDISENSFSN